MLNNIPLINCYDKMNDYFKFIGTIIFMYNIINYEKIQYIEIKKTEWSNNMLKKIYNSSTILRN